MPVEPGDTFIFDPDGTNQHHLWVVLTTYVPELEFEPFAIIAFISSVNARTMVMDRVCVLTPEDDDSHPYIHNVSYVVYSRLKVVPSAKLSSERSSTPVGRELLVRMQRGAHRSSLTKRGLKEFIPMP